MKTYLENVIRGFVAQYPDAHRTLTRWQEPLVSFVDALDPRLLSLKEQVSSTHLLPHDLLKNAKTVVVYFLPFALEVPKSNVALRNCSKEWATCYIETNQLIHDLNQQLKDELVKAGYQAAVTPATHNFDPETLVSNWSHRHLAQVAGLGSFGLNNMLLTEKGCCGRLGSLVTDLAIETLPLPFVEHCLYKSKGVCGICVAKCVNGALSHDGFDRQKCYAMCLENGREYTELGLCDVCGKCCVGLPCSFGNPGR